MVSLLAGIAWGCTTPTTTADVQRQVEAALYSFVQLDDAGFHDYRNRAIQSVGCLGEVVHTPHAGSFLRLEALAAFSSTNPQFAVGAFRSAFTVQPQHQLQAALAPPGGPLHGLYETARGAPATYWTLPQTGGIRFVNGVLTDQVPNGLAIVQLVESTGGVAWTGILTGPTDLPPDFAGPIASAPLPMPAPSAPPPMPAPVPVPAALPLPTPAPAIASAPVLPVPMPDPVATNDAWHPEDQARKKTAKIPVLIAAGVLGLAAGGVYSGSIISRGRYQAAPTAKRRGTTNNLWIASIGTAGVALSVGVVGLALPSKKKARSSNSDEFNGGLY